MIKFNRLTLVNFLSHRNSTIDFFYLKGLILIEGKNEDGHYTSNGAGKSTIIESIIWVLTGNTLRGVSVDDVVNRTSKKDTHVTLNFFIDETNYEITRYKKDTVHNNELILLKDSENISKRLNKDTQALIDSILNINFKVLSSTVLLGEGLTSRFTQLSDPDKKALIETSLSLQYDIPAIRDRVKSVTQDKEKKFSELSAVISTLSPYRDVESDSLETERSSLIESNQKLEIKRGDLIKESQSWVNKSFELDSKLSVVNSALTNYNNLLSKQSRLISEISQYNEKISYIESYEDPVCEVCKQKINSTESRNASLMHYIQGRDKDHSELTAVNQEMSGLPDTSILQSKLESLSNDKSQIAQKVSKTNNDLNTLILEKSQLESRLSQIEYILSQSKEANNRIQESQKELDSVSKDVEMYRYLQNLYSPTGIITEILQAAVDYINTRISVYSELLLEMSYQIKFKKGKIILEDTTGCSYQSLSNGEKKRLDISIQLAIHDYIDIYCGNHFNIMFIDEVMDSLDNIGTANIISVLRAKSQYCQIDAIFVITHNSELKSYFDNVLLIDKDLEGNSKIIS